MPQSPKSASALMAGLETLSRPPLDDFPVKAVRWDARECEPGDLFVSTPDLEIEGPYRSIDIALQRGARAVVAGPGTESRPGVTTVLVEDPRVALARLLYAFHGHPERRLKVIGVTGTKGKTTTTFLVQAALQAGGHRAAVLGSNGVFLEAGTRLPNFTWPAGFTTPESHVLAGLFARLVDDGIEYAVLETSSHGLQLQRVAGIAFAGAIFTNLYSDHLDFHGTRENYAASKASLFARLAPHAPAVFNGDDSYARFMAASSVARENTFVGRRAGADIRIVDESLTAYGLEFTLTGEPGARTVGRFRLPLLGRFNTMNASLAITLCRSLGVGVSAMAASLPAMTGVPGRMQVFRGPRESLTVVDYAHCARSLREALVACRRVLGEQRAGRLTVVFGCGGDRDPSKRPKMGRVAARLADRVVITDDNPRSEDGAAIARQILSGIPTAHQEKVLQIRDRAEAIRRALDGCAPGDVLLIAGKGCEQQQIIGSMATAFSDAGVVQDYLRSV